MASKPSRMESLDAVRGLTMAGMVIVNNPGDWGHVYWPLEHAEWNGCTPTDLIFPFFLFIVGVSITLSRGTMGNPWKIVKRSIVIFGLGFLLTFWPRFDLSVVRIPGVLARIAVCYLVAAFLFRSTARRDDATDAGRLSHGVKLGAMAVALTLGYWLVMTWIPAPGGVAGDLTPNGNLGAWLDRTLLGGHLWSQSKTWDPEGILSTFPAIATTLLGTVAGLWLASGAPKKEKAITMALVGVIAMVVGYLWDCAFPINKGLWTSSYVWFTAGGAALLLAVSYMIIDVYGWRRWARPFVILGLNAITLFVLSGYLAKQMGLIKFAGTDGKVTTLSRYVYTSWFVPLADPYNASLLYACANLVVLFGVLYVMHRRGLYLKA
ncbi:MAG: heparan-alpha-glucosaminide N-acetyltransferase domain-containing protein [Acidobacteria bacterium]|nr:heparan-alpha-glucosaminide N-acetyltransferase domain-containing protein [Acidobacteriota bacterium]